MSSASNGARIRRDRARGELWVSRPIAETPRAAMDVLVKNATPLEIAGLLNIHNTHVYNYRNKGRVSPTVTRALVKEGFVPEPEKEYRRAAYLGKGDDGRALSAAWDEYVSRFGGMTALVKGLLDGKYEVIEREGE